MYAEEVCKDEHNENLEMICFSRSEFKCGCGWKTSVFFVLASSKEEAIEKVKNLEGLCAYCFLDMLIEKEAKILMNH